MHTSRTVALLNQRAVRRKALAVVAGAVVLLTGGAAGPTQAVGYVLPMQSASADDQAASSGSSGPSEVSRTRQWPPTPSSVGVPDGTDLSPYKGSCTITRAKKVIRAKTINCSTLEIKTRGVVIRKSKINGAILVGTQDDYEPTKVSDPEGDGPIRVRVIRSEIETPASSDFRPISSSHYVVKGSYLHGTYSGAECHNACTIKWSYVHGHGSHASGMRILRNGTLKNNTIWCEPKANMDDGGCSGNLTMYEEFGIPHHNLVRHNYFPAGKFWYNLKFNGRDKGHIRIIKNRFGIPKSGGGLTDDWDRKRTNKWRGNKLTNGQVARPS